MLAVVRCSATQKPEPREERVGVVGRVGHGFEEGTDDEKAEAGALG